MNDFSNINDIIFSIENSSGSSKEYYETVYEIFYDLISKFPLPYTPFPTPVVFRARKNLNDELFYYKHEIGTPPQENIKLIGRANLPHQPIFYGAIPSEKILNEKAINAYQGAIFESCKDLWEINEGNYKKRFTVGEWRITQPFNCIFLSFANSSINENKSVKKSADQYLTKLNQKFSTKEVENIIFFLKWISEKFGEFKVNTKGYLITTAFFNSIIDFCKTLTMTIGALIYPSSKTESECLNVSITPHYAFNFLNLNRVAMIECTIHNRERLFIPSKLIQASSLETFNFLTDKNIMISNKFLYAT